MYDHDISPDHIHAMLVTHHVEDPQKDVYAATMSVIRGALAFALNHPTDMTEWNYETVCSLRLNLHHAGGMGEPVKDEGGVYR